ncbi:phage-related lysozyme (muraminidase) [Enterobacteriaceae bacterium strain FGI 57]|nr:phage-related lysozyme (muraminidase) [Enterobacteriaceae bacterium strain FGI 57]
MPNTALRLSPEGLAFIKQYQGFSAEPYQDECHLWVVGYGHLIQGSEAFVTPLSQPQADALLQLDIYACERVLAQEIAVPLNQIQYDALISLALSLGPETFAASAVVRYINQRQFAKALSVWLMETELNGVRSNGLNRQRQAECALFRTDLGREFMRAE